MNERYAQREASVAIIGSGHIGTDFMKAKAAQTGEVA